MFTLQLTTSYIALASYKRYSNSLPTIQKRMEVLLLAHYTDLKYDLVATIAGIHRDTVTDYINCINVRYNYSKPMKNTK